MPHIEQDKMIRGHSCKGVVEMHAARAGEEPCMPWINDRGGIEACDATNNTAISFCPYCGKALAPATPIDHRLPAEF